MKNRDERRQAPPQYLPLTPILDATLVITSVKCRALIRVNDGCYTRIISQFQWFLFLRRNLQLPQNTQQQTVAAT